MKRKDLESMDFATKAIHGGTVDDQFGALATPIHQTSTFIFDSADQGGRRFALEEEGYIYSRLGNPTCTVVEEKLALLEGAEACVASASGMGAICSAIWVCVEQGSHIIAGKTLYGCTYAFLSKGITRYGVDVSFVDMSDPENVRKAMRPNTKVVYVETPGNPNMVLSDIEAIAKVTHENDGCILMVDNTYCSPYLCRPIDFGADVVVHSATKYLNGHGDVIAGFVLGKKEYIDQVRLFGIKDLTGASLGAFEAFLIARGMKTLNIRMDRHTSNAQAVAEFLESHPAVETVLYPGLKSFPQSDLAKKQMKQSGGMIAFELKGGLEAGKKLMEDLHLFKLAVSLGDTESLIQHPASMTHSPYSPEERALCGISETLVRASVGLEDPKDLIADLKQALDKQ